MITEQEIKEAIDLNPHSMTDAARYLKIPFGTFKYAAKKYGLYAPQPHKKGNPVRKGKEQSKESFLKILSGEQAFRGSGQQIKRRLIKYGFLKDVCIECGQLPEHNKKPLILQLDHIDGNHFNWKLENLRIVCPNCHTQTITFSGRSKKDKKNKWIGDYPILDIENIVKEHEFVSIAELARFLGVNDRSSSVYNILYSIVERVCGEIGRPVSLRS